MRAESYNEAESFLNMVPRFTGKNPLEKTKKFYDYIQNRDGGAYSEARLGKIVHVAGTNGKGSVCAFLERICIEDGYRTAMFTSPHLVTTRERFRVDGMMISEEKFVYAFNRIEDMLEKYREDDPSYAPSYFERLFFMGLYIFTSEGVDITILETGLGGRLDTTNVIKAPKLCVITEIGYDHMEYLGSTIEQIAAEKAGIIKSGVPVVFCDRRSAVSGILRQKASECGCICHSVSKKDYKICEIQKKSIDFSVSSSYYGYCRFTINSTALYQVENAALAVKAAELLNINVSAVGAGIAAMKWSGRMEEILPRVYIDGAHNEDGIEAFAKTVKRCCPDIGESRCFLIFSAVRDKDCDSMVKLLTDTGVFTDYIVTRIPNERGIETDRLVKMFEAHTDKNVHAFDKIDDALEYALTNRGDLGMVYIVGSLYLAGIVKAHAHML